ncbi:MAG: TMEM175 family protein [Planctomycetota bacterium]
MVEQVPVAPRWLDREFRWRGTSVTRMEALSDSVFAIVLGLLFLRAMPPETFAELKVAMKALVPFAACFAIIAYIWIEHWLFSRRYDLQDGWIKLLHLVLLFLLLSYAYPLKWLFTALAVGAFGKIGELDEKRVRVGFDGSADAVRLFTFYGLGYGLLFVVLALMYWRALAFAPALGLDRVERFLTRSAIVQCLLQAGVAALSIVLAVLGVGTRFGLPGWIYCGLGPLMAAHGVWQGRAVDRLRAAA